METRRRWAGAYRVGLLAGLTLPYLLQLRYATSLIQVYYVVGATLLPFDKIAADDNSSCAHAKDKIISCVSTKVCNDICHRYLTIRIL
jgi:hypothetical protein